MTTSISSQGRSPKGETRPVSSAGLPLLLQRKCACGGTPGADGECSECRKKRLGLQRKAAGPGPGATTAPPIVPEVLRSPGQPLEREARAFMEPRFGHDFSKIRVHNDARAAESARSVGALAYTVGKDIVFGAGRYSPGETGGRRLLAHELAHTIQQGGGAHLQSKLEVSSPDSPAESEADAAAEGVVGSLTPIGPMLQKQEDSIEVELEPVSPEDADRLRRQEGINLPQVSQQTYAASGGQTFFPGTHHWDTCGRSSTLRADGFRGNTHGTYISSITVTIKPTANSTVSLSWANPQMSTGTLQTSLIASPGAGNCDTDCSVTAKSQRDGSHCTPVGNFTVQGYDCHLPGDSAAEFVSWFHRKRGIAFHYYDVPSFPASHGCVRMSRSESGAEWIFDNSLAGITQVTVNREPSAGPGLKCWSAGTLVDRPPATPPRRRTR
jgi:uncharacterized protein DUF4157/L,D-transpeptidase-like protein